MGMTITEKILAAKAGLATVSPGQIVRVPVDLALSNDITTPLAVQEFERAGATKVFDREKVVLVPDHFSPNKDIQSAEQCQVMREFARRHEIVNYFELGRMGIEHALLPEAGLVRPGMVIVGADSHTCTYGALGAFATGMGSTDVAAAWITGWTWLKVPPSLKFVFSGAPRPWVGGKDYILAVLGRIGVDGALYSAMEFTGEAISALGIDGRLTMCNMAIEAGGKNGIIAADAVVDAYLEGRTREPGVKFASDPDAAYVSVHEIDVAALEPQVARPHSPANVVGVSQVSDVRIDQAFVGSCTNGRISDLREAARVLHGRRVHRDVRMIVIPATQAIYRQAIKEGLLDTFVEAGAAVSTPTCGPCLGGHMGILAKGEVAIATSNRNFLGRMGHLQSEVYLAGPAVAAASAVLGRIAHPQELGVKP
jgi:3-isopropylmalate/(R)-2-methylmalate dehydratase large subunit